MDDLLVGNTTVRPFWAFPELSQERFTSTRPLFSCTPWEQENEYWRRNNAHVPSNGEKKGLFKKQNHLKIRSCNKTLTKDIWPIFYPVYAETYVRLTNNFFFLFNLSKHNFSRFSYKPLPFEFLPPWVYRHVWRVQCILREIPVKNYRISSSAAATLWQQLW